MRAIRVTMPHRVLILNGPMTPPFGGVATLLDHQLPHLALAGHEVHTLMAPGYAAPGTYADREALGVHVDFGTAGRWPRLRSLLRRLPTVYGWWRESKLPASRFRRIALGAAVWLPVAERIIRERDIAYDMPWIQGLAGAWLKERYGCKFVFTNFGEVLPHTGELQHHDPDGEPLRPLVQRVFRTADRIFSVSYHCAREVAHSGFPSKTVGCIYGGVDLSEFTPGEGTAEERNRLGEGPGPRILFLGQVRERKGPHTLVEAMAKVHAAVPDAQCAIVGPDHGVGEALRARISELGLEQVVRLTGPITGSVADLYRACDIFVFPSLTNIECLGLSTIQAMACAKAVVASRVGGVPEVVSHERTGLLFAAGDPGELGDAVIRFCREPELRTRLGAAARQESIDRFDRGAYADQVLALYDSVAAGEPAPESPQSVPQA